MIYDKFINHRAFTRERESRDTPPVCLDSAKQTRLDNLNFNWLNNFRFIFIFLLILGSFFVFTGQVFAAVDCTATATTGVPQTECEALMALYNSTTGASWTDAATNNWNTASAVSTWTGVTVSGGHVTAITRSSKGLVGSLPTSIGNLPSLTSLNLFNNTISGSLPTEIGNLTNLGSLNLAANRLSGSIPSEIANLTNLTTLMVHGNQLTGAIPSFSNLTKLVTLYLSSNQLTGSIPSGLSSTLRTLVLNANYLSGIIPSNIASIPLTTFNIKDNNFVFSDIEPGFASYSTYGAFTYSTQRNVDSERTLTFTAGDTLTITPSVEANANDIYQWYKSGVAISGATSRVYTKTAEDSDNGVYTYITTNSVVTSLTLSSNDITVSVTPNPPSSDNIYYIIGDDDIWIRGAISNTKDIAQYYEISGSSNNTFYFGYAYLINSSTPNYATDYMAGTQVSTGGDDTAPINTANVGYILGSHGVYSPVVTSTGHDKTSADIGSIWSDGTYQYILANISGNALTFYSVPAGSPWSMRSTVAGTLTHVSGATHTGNITVTSQTGAAELTVIKNIVRHTLINGETEAISGDEGYADYVDFTEEFDLVDPSTIVRTNNPWLWNDGEVWMHVKNIYRLTAGDTVIHTTYEIVRPMNLGYLGIIQAIKPILAPYDHEYYYIPKTKTISGYDFKNIQLVDENFSGQLNFFSENIDDSNNPPNRQIILKKYTAEDNYDIGFAFGYGPYGDTVASNRDCLSGGVGCWYMSSVGKTYPSMIANVGVVDDVTYDAYAYRQWIDPKQYDIGKLAYWNNQNGHDVVYVDYHRSADDDTTALPSKFIGKTVRVVESENIETPTSIIPSSGNLTLSTTGANTYGYAVLELTDTQVAPTASPSTGIYTANQSITLSATGSTSIRYSNTEMPADCTSGILYSAPISITSNQTIYTRACNSDGNSATANFTYTLIKGGGLSPSSLYPPVKPFNSNFQVSINKGESRTNNSVIKLTLTTGSNTKRVAISEDPNFTYAPLLNYQPEMDYILSSGNGLKTIYVKFYTEYGIASGVISDTITLNQGSTSSVDKQQTIIWTPPIGYEYITGPSQIKNYTKLIKDPNSNRLYGLPKNTTQPIIITGQFNNDLYYGLTNNQEVKRLQEFLIVKGYLATGLNTGNYYRQTQNAVRKFQKDHNITPANGRFGPKTRGAVNKEM